MLKYKSAFVHRVLSKQFLLRTIIAFIAACPMLRVCGQEEADRITPDTLPKNEVVATLMVGAGPNLIVVNPDNIFVYVVNQNDNTISEIYAPSKIVVKSFSAGANPIGMAITPDGTEVYVTNSISPGTVTVLNASTGTLLNQIAGLGNKPKFLAISPDGKQAYVPNVNSGTVSVIDTKTKTVTKSIAIGTSAEAVAFTPDGRTAYVCDGNDNAVFVIDTAAQAVIGSGIKTTNPNFCAVNPKGEEDVYVVSLAKRAFVVIQDNKVIKNIKESNYPGYCAVTPDGKYLYLPLNSSNSGPSNKVIMVSTTTYKTVGKPITVGFQPRAVAITPDQKFAYVTNYQDDTVSVIDIQPGKLSQSVSKAR